MRGSLPSVEILEKVNVIELIVNDVLAGKSVCKICAYWLAVVSPSGMRKKLHSRNDPGVVHVNSSKPPLHTGATPGGVITTPIIITSLSLCYYGQFIIQKVIIPAVVSQICRSKTLAKHKFNDSDGFMARLSILSSKILHRKKLIVCSQARRICSNVHYLS